MEKEQSSNLTFEPVPLDGPIPRDPCKIGLDKILPNDFPGESKVSDLTLQFQGEGACILEGFSFTNFVLILLSETALRIELFTYVYTGCFFKSVGGFSYEPGPVPLSYMRAAVTTGAIKGIIKYLSVTYISESCPVSNQEDFQFKYSYFIILTLFYSDII